MPRSKFALPHCDDLTPDAPVEVGNGEGVGWWVPRDKHTYLAKWIDGTREARRKNWKHLVLVDAFSGPGRIRVKDEVATRPGGCVIAWLQSVASKVPFTHVLIGDIDQERADACEQRLRAVGAPVRKFAGPAAETIPAMVQAIPSGALVLAYLDPYNLALLHFDIIKQLAALKHIDFAVHFSVYDMYRNVDMELDDERARFDEAAPGWRQAIDVHGMSKTQLKQAFLDYWMGLVRGLGFTFSEAMPLVRGDRNAPMYRLACFSRHPLPNKVWRDVARDDNMSLF